MMSLAQGMSRHWLRIPARLLPFADAASAELPLPRLLRLALFQVSVAMALVLLNGTLNRIMIVELGVSSSIVALMISLPLLFAPLRAFIGFRSDTHKSAIGWRRAPYIWIGSLLQFGGLSIMPFALILLSGDSIGPAWVGVAGAALAFLLVGAGLHTTQTAGLALATDIAPESTRPRVVAFLYIMLLAGSIAGSLIFGQLLASFSQLRLIQVIQGAAVATILLNVVALWKQEVRMPGRGLGEKAPLFSEAWDAFVGLPGARRTLCAVGLGTAAFAMQDILLEPYGGEILHLSVGDTTLLTSILSAGALGGFAVAAQLLTAQKCPYRISAAGAICGLVAFPCVMFSGAIGSALLFRAGTFGIGLGSGLFSVGALAAAMDIARRSPSGLALGAWGAVQACAAGLAIAASGLIKDVVARLASDGTFGAAVAGPGTGYNAVYLVEIFLLFATLAAAGPLVRRQAPALHRDRPTFGLTEFPG